MASTYQFPWHSAGVGLNYPCASNGLCAAMTLADGAGPTKPGVSEVPVGGYNGICGSGEYDMVRKYTYFPASWSNQSINKVYPGYVNAFGLTQYDQKVRCLNFVYAEDWTSESRCICNFALQQQFLSLLYRWLPQYSRMRLSDVKAKGHGSRPASLVSARSLAFSRPFIS